jgi:hypothetical protein
MPRLKVPGPAAIGVLIALAGVVPAYAQLNTQHIKGTVGLKSGSQPPPHWYLVAPLVYVYDTDTVRNVNGDKFPIDASITSSVYGLGLSHVTTKTLFGGNYGYQVLVAGVNNRLQGTEIDFNPGGGLTDTAFAPIILGWHGPRYDAITQFMMYLPTGRYEAGARDNLGFGMWGFEPAAGATFYLTENRMLHAATLASLTFQTKKEDSDTQVGTALNLEGGIGGDFLKGGLTAGLNYYASFKLQEDEIDGVPGILVRGKNKVFAIGPEVTLALAAKGTVFGFVKATYQWEVYAQTNTQGNAFTVTASFPLPGIKIPTP